MAVRELPLPKGLLVAAAAVSVVVIGLQQGFLPLMPLHLGPLDSIASAASWLRPGRASPAAPPPPRPTDLVLETWATCRRDPGKRGRTAPQPWRGPEYSEMDCGEDAFLVTERVLGIADGVGSWRKKGVDPSIFSNRLLENAKAWVEKQGNLDPVFIMQKAYAQICKNREVKAGSSTAVIASLMDSDGGLKVANLGDSGLMVVRDEQCVFHMPETVWRFNTPYQLTAPPSSWGSQAYGDQPDQAAVSSVQLQEGDLVVMGSDGLFDNLFPTEIAQIVAPASAPPSSFWARLTRPMLTVRQAAELLRERVFVASQDRYRDTPFARDAHQSGLQYSGGKPDDITVIVSKVRRRGDLEEEPARGGSA